MTKVIIVTGTPGTGKTMLSKELAKKLNYSYVDINRIISRYKLSESYDEKKKCKVVDENKLANALVRTVKCATKNVIVDGHLSHFMPLEWVDLCIVTRCGLKELKKRLEARGYSEQKVRDNMDCEIMDVCLIEAKERGHKVIIVEATKKPDMKRVIERIKSL